MRRRLSAAAVVIAILGAVSWSTTAASADEVDDFTFASFDAHYYLSRADDGSSRLRTVETLIAEFPDQDQNRGILRAIPQSFNGADVGLEIESVTDENGEPIPFETEPDDGFLVVATGTDEFVRGSRTYVLSYEQRNVVRAYDDTAADEFYWDANGTGWEQRFGEVTARVHVDSAIADELTGSAACYLGAQGSSDRCEIARTGDADDTVFAASGSDLGPGENLTVAIGFERGTFIEPPRARDAAWVTAFPIGLAITALLGALSAVALRLTVWRDHRGRGIIVPEYSPQPDVDLIAAGDLVGRRATSLSAALIDLAVRGNLRIIDTSGPHGDTDAKKRYRAEFVRADGTSAQERRILNILFGTDAAPGKQRALDALSADRSRRLHRLPTTEPERAVTKGWRRQLPRGLRRATRIVAVAIGSLAIVAFIALVIADAVLLLPSLLLLAALGLAIVALVTPPTGPVLTAEGAARRDHLVGLRRYLDLAEADRLRMLQSPDGAERRPVDVSDRRQLVALVERLLPYAMLWGVERKWAAELERLYADNSVTADWYRGPGSLDTAVFIGLLTSLSSVQSSASSAAWATSGSSSSFGGSTGGGFSGGGGGGGGGGGR